MHEPPDTLGEPERELWTKTLEQFEFSDDASLALLRSALEAHQLGRECWEQIQQDGLTHKGRPHCLLITLRDSRKAFAALLRQLDLEPVERRSPGRPAARGPNLALLKPRHKP
jgi:hypothetical protein